MFSLYINVYLYEVIFWVSVSAIGSLYIVLILVSTLFDTNVC